MDKKRLQQLAGVQLAESITSDLGRKMTGKVSSKEHIRRTALLTLQRVADEISTNNLQRLFGSTPDEEIYGYMDTLRADVINAIKTIKSIEE